MFKEIFNEFINNLRQFFAIHPVYFTIIIIAISVLIIAVVLYFVVQTSDFSALTKNEEKLVIQNIFKEKYEKMFVNNVEVIPELEQLVIKSEPKQKKVKKKDSTQTIDKKSEIHNKNDNTHNPVEERPIQDN